MVGNRKGSVNGNEKEVLPNLPCLMREWINGDPTLNEHFIVLEGAWMVGEEVPEFTINIRCRLRPYQVVAWFSDRKEGLLTMWEHLGSYDTDKIVNMQLADPTFLDKVLKLLREAHNGATFYTDKGNSWHSTAFGCSKKI